MKPVVSPRELADAIGVSESSLKRWTDNGSLAAGKTVGGHRRISIGEAIRFVRETRIALVRPEVLGLSDVARAVGDVATTGSDAERLFTYLRDGRAAEARGLVSSLYLAGQSVAQICDGAVRLAMERIGQLWTCEDNGILVEHRATDICVQAVQQLRELLAGVEEPVSACGGALSGDPYVLPSLTVSLALEAEGIGAANIGPETPMHVLAQAAESPEVRLIWISVSVVSNVYETAREIERLGGVLAARGVALVVGGRASHGLVFSATARVAVAPTLGELTAFAKGWRHAREQGA